MTNPIIFIFLFLFLSVPSAVGQTYQFPLKVSASQRYLVDQSEKPFFYNGDTGWKLFLKLSKADVIKYLSDRKAKKFTVIQTMLTGFTGEKNMEGHGPFADLADFSTVDAAYFDHVGWVLRQADSLGLLVAMAPLWAGCCGEGYAGRGVLGDKSVMHANGVTRCRDFGEYVGKRFAKYNNILWIIGGDNDPHSDRELMHQLALGIRAQAPHQLMTYHPSSTRSSTDAWDNPGWLDVTMTYTYFRGFNKAWNKNQPDVYEMNFKEYAKQPVRPFFLGESTYEGEHDDWGSAVQARKQAYWSVLSGAMGHAYGSPMWNFPENWASFLELPGGKSMQHLYTLFHERSWFQLMPDPESKIIVEGQGTYAQNDYAVAAADENGRFIIAYIPSGRTIKINTAVLAGQKIRANWYNPGDGTWRSASERAKPGGVVSFTTPDANDWVLVLDRVR